MSKDLIEGDYDPKDVKVKVTVYIDGDIVDQLRDRAKQEGLKYQPYINKLLRQAVAEKPLLEEIQDRLVALEENVGIKKKAQ
jgi:hypothetical protein